MVGGRKDNSNIVTADPLNTDMFQFNRISQTRGGW